MFGRKSNETTRTTTGSSVTSPRQSTTMPGGKATPRGRGGFLRRFHPDHTNQALETKINSPRTSEREAQEAQNELRDRGVTPPKRNMSARIARMRNKWHSSGKATSKTAPQTY